MSKYELIVLFDGYSTTVEEGMKANCTCTLLKSEKNKIIIDTRTPWDGDSLFTALQQQNIKPEDINYVISTHSHSDHIGCNYLFQNALHIVGKTCISRNDLYYDYDFKDNHVIDEYVKLITTPGHTSECITVLVQTQEGLIAIVGDLFEKKQDMDDEELWKCCSDFPEIQEESRRKILEIADFIVPGHGPMFKNPNKT